MGSLRDRLLAICFTVTLAGAPATQEKPAEPELLRALVGADPAASLVWPPVLGKTQAVKVRVRGLQSPSL